MRRQDLGSYSFLLAILLTFAGFAWLSRNLRSPLLDPMQDWPWVGGSVRDLRQAYLPPPPHAVQDDRAPTPELEVLSPPAVEVGSQRRVWVLPGTQLQAEPDRGSPVFETATAIRNLSVFEQRGDWYRVWVPRSPQPAFDAWVWLPGYEDPQGEISRQAEPVLPLAASAPDAQRVVAARGLMLEEGQERSCGPQTLYTDVPSDAVIAACGRLVVNLEAAYRQRYGLEPVSPPAEAIFYFRRDGAYRAFRAQEKMHFESGPAHASPARGYVAVSRGTRSSLAVLSSLVHELTHLLNRRSLGPALPPWLSEGMADDLAESRIEVDGTIDPTRLGGETLEDGSQIVRQGGQAAAILLQESSRNGDQPTLSELMEMDEREFYRPDRAELHYALSSFWVRYMASGFEPSRSRGFRGFLGDVAAGGTLSAELLRARLAVDTDELEADFYTWLHLQFVRPPGEQSGPSS